MAPAQPAAPVTAQAPAPQPPLPTPGMRLAQAVETVNQVIRISQSSGITQARVTLHPEELGSIDIHLRSTPDGIVARVVADATQAAAVLRDGGDDLRRMLANQGINLSHFDVGTSRDGGQSGFQAGDGERRQGGSAGSDTPDQDSPAETTEETTISLPNGVLVDVLA
jgi:flagellar hook-length control protein FliK